MAHLFQPKYTRKVPANAKIVRVKIDGVKVRCARWDARGGRTITAPLSDDGMRCTVTVECWYLTYVDHKGKEFTEKCFPSRRLSERRLHDVLDRIDGIKAKSISEAAHPQREKSIDDLLDQWRQSILDGGASEKQADQARHRVDATMRRVGVSRPAEIVKGEVAQALAIFREHGVPRDHDNKQKPKPLSPRTSNHYLKACKNFTAWLADNGYLDVDPLSRMKGLPVEGLDTYTRRAMTPAQLEQLVAATLDRKSRCPLLGPDRAAFYLTAFYTGYRLNELGELTPPMFELDGDTPSIFLPARFTKNKKDARQFLPATIAERLKEYIDTKPMHLPVWGSATNLFAGTKMVNVFRKDLAAAGVDAETAAGRLDIHALRTSFITAAGLAGNDLQIVQRMARHSDPRLTMKHYLRVGESDLAGAAKKLA